ncbi:laccase-2-like [Anneissia japonica]|uniref:laccase-2-like n=1 Tax=Anneissia japonica TaxID=1529436 RepID=UPI00142565E3|nr:laccase-2-like [Anneissia japonica]
MKIFNSALFILPVLCTSVFAGVVYEGPDCKRECKSPAENAVCKYNFEVEWYHSLSKACYDCPFNLSHCKLEDCIPLNGVERPVMVVNRALPGPTIEVCEGDTIEVQVTNNLDNAEGLSLHWHGLHAIDAPYMDGVSMITQCPITSQSSFLYTFNANPPGTHWWHSHAGMQRADGLFGPLIVKKPKSGDTYSRLYDYDEHVLLVNDWLHELTIERFSKYHHSIGSNSADSILINGKGIYKTLTKGNSEANTPREMFTVKQGKRYRFRTINGAITNCALKISVDEHRITMIASDGAEIDKEETDSFIIYAGERYDFVLYAKQSINNYWIRVNGVEGCSKLYELAILRYEGAPDGNPSGLDGYDPQIGTTVNALSDDIKPAHDDDITIRQLTSRDEDDVAFSREADKTFYIGMDFSAVNNIHFNQPDFYPVSSSRITYSPQLNHISFAFPSSPPLSQCGDIPKGTFCSEDTFTKLNKNCSAEFCQCAQTINVTLNEVVELVVVNEGKNFDVSHPMHLHGQYFRVIGFEKLGKSTTVDQVKEMDKNGNLRREPHLSLKKDTVIVPDGGYVILRFHATNPGWWFFHCHLEFHVEIGMALIVHVGEQDDLPEVAKNFPKCGNFPNKGNSVFTTQSLAIILFFIFYFV